MNSHFGRALASSVGMITASILVILLAHVALASMCYGAWSGAAWAAAAGALVMTGSRLRRGPRILAAGLLLLLLPIAGVLFVLQSNARMRDLWALAKDKQLHATDHLAIYAFGTLMPYGAILIGAPEVAIEHALMYIPGDDRRVRLYSSFAAKHATVERILDRFVNTLDRSEPHGSRKVLPPTHVPFFYPGGVPDRVSLALNTPDAKLSATAVMGRDGWNVEAQIAAGISYPPQSNLKIVLLKGLTFDLQEGLLHALQEAHWLHPYEQIWTWRFKVRLPS